jgi:glycogen synthase
MHIVLVSKIYPPDNGWDGIGTYTYHMSRALVDYGHKVTVLCGFENMKTEKRDGNLNVLRYLKINEVGWRVIQMQVADALEMIYAKNRFDVVEFPEYGAPGLLFQRRNSKIPVVVKLHADSKTCFKAAGPFSLKRFFSYYFPNIRNSVFRLHQAEKESVSRSTFTIAPSLWFLDKLKREKWQMPSHNCVVPNPFGGLPNLSNHDSIDYSAKRVVFLGRLQYRKGTNRFPQIIFKVLEQNPGANFEIIGQDGKKSRQETWAQWFKSQLSAKIGNINIRGGIPYTEIGSILKTCNIACFISTFETFSYTMAECMSLGLACVDGSIGGSHELGENGVSIISCSRDPIEIANKITELLNKPEYCGSIGKTAKIRIHNKFRGEVIAGSMNDVYMTSVKNCE